MTIIDDAGVYVPLSARGFDIRKMIPGDEQNVSDLVIGCIKRVVGNCPSYGLKVAEAISKCYTPKNLEWMMKNGDHILICSKNDDLSGTVAYDPRKKEIRMWYFKAGIEGFKAAKFVWEDLLLFAKGLGHEYMWGKVLSTARPMIERYGGKAIYNGLGEEDAIRFPVSIVVKPLVDDFDFNRLEIKDKEVVERRAA